ncbi:hypothetical protein ACIOEX_03320 [Streptomyces sp. NPDC087850]|uniref:hypothetical protein n=1 Tax=Streptomyces sp. NPDC087850 TaxID=3365809 RepID=UPI0037F6746E
MSDRPRSRESLELIRRRIALRKLRALLENQRAAALVERTERFLREESVQGKLLRAELDRLDDPEHFDQLFRNAPPGQGRTE